MSKNKKETKELLLGDLFAYSKILDISSDNRDFEKWLEEYHGIKLDEDVYPGYRFFIDCSLRAIINELYTNDIFGFEKNRELLEGCFKGVDLKYLPETNDKTVFLKELSQKMKPVIKSHDIEDYEKNYNRIENLINLIEEIGNKYTNPKLDSKEGENSLKRSIMFRLWDKYLDCNKGMPMLYTKRPPFIDMRYRPEYLIRVYSGYVYTLQYVWYEFLGEEKFLKSPIKDIHRAEKKYSEELKPKIIWENLPLNVKHKEKENKPIKFEDRINKKNNDDILEIIHEKNIEKFIDKKDVKNKVKWYSLDKYYSIMEKELNQNINKYLKDNGKTLLTLTSSIDKDLLHEFLKIKIDAGKYEEQKSSKNVKEKLHQYLFWDPVQVLDTGQLLDFNGVTAFYDLLIGIIKNKKIKNIKEKIPVRIFKHPKNLPNEKTGYDFSFGLYIEAFDQSSGCTGWIIFYNCATDYSSHGNTMYEKAKSAIYYFESLDEIEVKEMEVDKDIFKDTLKLMSVNSVFDTIKSPKPMGLETEIDITEIKEELNQFIGNAKGKLFEYLFYRWFVENELENYKIKDPDSKIKSINENEVQIEFYVIHDKIDLFECKVKLHESDFREKNSIFKQLNEQKKELKRRYPNKEVCKNLIVYQEAKDEWEKKIKNENIALKYYPFENYLKKCKNKEVKKLENILKENISYISQE